MATTVEKLMVEVEANTSRARAELASLDKTTAKTTGSSTKRLAGLAKGMGLAFGGVAVVGGITKTIGLAMDFDKTMRQVGVQTGLTGDKIEHLGDLAKAMGKATIFSAQDAGEAMLELSKGGLTAADIRAGALKQTLTLAAAGGMGLADSAGIMANALNMFGLKAKNSSEVTTALAGAANASTASVDSLRMALSQVGSGARGTGLDIQTTVAALAEFDNAGIKGSDAGTSLKTMLQRLTPTYKKQQEAIEKYNLKFADSHGNFLSLAQIAQNLKDRLGGLSAVQRQQALNTIFGSDASRAAAVLMRGGAKTLQHYTKAAKDQATTQKMANAAMQGASGAWENFKGTIETLAISVGQKALPMVTKLLNQGNELLNSADKWGPGVAKDFGWIIPAAAGVIAVVKPLAGLVIALAKGFEALPDPVKQTTTALIAAALIFPRLSAAAVSMGTPVATSFTNMSAKAKQFRAEMTYSATRAQALGGALRSVAGPAGMGLLITGASSSNQALKDLSTIGGGALMGFAAGGPIGAAVGGGAGLLGVLASHLSKAGDAAKASRADYSGLAGTLDSLTGATTASTRAFVYDQLQRSGAIKNLAAYGIAAKTAVGAVMGEAKARNVVNAALAGQQRNYDLLIERINRMKKAQQAATVAGQHAHGGPAINAPSAAQIGALEAQARAQKNVIDGIRDGVGAVRKDVAAAHDRARAIQDLTGKLKGLPKFARTRIEAEGVDPTLKGIARVAKQYGLTPKQIKTVIAAVGVDTTVKQVKKVEDGLHAVDRVRPNLSQFKASLSSQIDQAGGMAHTKGSQVGASLGSGIKSGLAATLSGIGNAAAAAVQTAIAAARKAAKAHSPSRETRDKVGKPLADGIIEGIKRRHKALVESGKSMIRDVMAGVRQSKGDALHVLKQIGKWADRHLSGKAEDHWAQRVKNATRRVAGDYDRLRKVTEKLTQAQNHLNDLRGKRSEFMSNIVSGMTSQASIANAGADARSIAANLKTQAAKVKDFANMLRKLKKRGWADQIIRDIAAAGVEGGYDTAKALLAADAQTEASINASYRSIYKTAQQSAKTMGDAMYGAGIKTAEGVVKGLKDRQRQIKDLLLKIAAGMADAIRNAIGLPPAKGHKGRHGGNGNGPGPMHHHGVGSGSGAGTGAPRPRLRQADTGTAVKLRDAKVIHFHFRTYYPISEPQSKTTNKALQRVAALGLIG